MKKALAALLAVILVLSCFPLGVLAAEEEDAPEFQETVEALEGSASEEPALDEEPGYPSEAAEDESETALTEAAEAADQDWQDDEAVSEDAVVVEESEPAEEPEEPEEVLPDDADAEEGAEAAEETGELDGEAGRKAAPDFSGLNDGWNYLGGEWYYLRNQTAVTGWAKLGSNWYYLDPDNYGAMATGLIDISGDGRYYLEPETGIMKTGWVLTVPAGYDASSWFYFGSSGRASSGWSKLGGKWYYLDPNNGSAMATGMIDIEGDGKYYLSPATGIMQTGWVQTPENGNWYYFQSSGRSANGWAKLGGKWYYLDPNNDSAMATGMIDIEGDGRYYLSPATGIMQTGWVQTPENGNWYYFQSSGRGVNGWLETGSIWTARRYYLDPEKNGAMVTGWKDIDNDRYYMYSSGSAATGWLSFGETRFFFDVLGRMMTGWAFIDSDDYYFYKDGSAGTYKGAMAANTVVDGRAIDEEGHAELPELDESATAEDMVIARAQYYSSDTSNLIVIDRDTCHFYVFEGSTGNWNLTNNWRCTVGAYSTQTPTGSFIVQDQGLYFDAENEVRCFWWTQFWGSYCIHSILYHQDGYSTSTATVMNPTLGYWLSHGCVRLATNNAKWVCYNIDRGTSVVVM